MLAAVRNSQVNGSGFLREIITVLLQKDAMAQKPREGKTGAGK
jgi:hypothetical protein